MTRQIPLLWTHAFKRQVPRRTKYSQTCTPKQTEPKNRKETQGTHKIQTAGLTYADAVRTRQKPRKARAHVASHCVGARAVFTAKPHVALVEVFKDIF